MKISKVVKQITDMLKRPNKKKKLRQNYDIFYARLKHNY